MSTPYSLIDRLSCLTVFFMDSISVPTVHWSEISDMFSLQAHRIFQKWIATFTVMMSFLSVSNWTRIWILYMFWIIALRPCEKGSYLIAENKLYLLENPLVHLISPSSWHSLPMKHSMIDSHSTRPEGSGNWKRTSWELSYSYFLQKGKVKWCLNSAWWQGF